MLTLPKYLITAALSVALPLTACREDQTTFAENAVVSMTLCADGYLHSLPDVEPRLAALSWQSRSALSQTPEHLRHLPQTDTDPERRRNWTHTTQISSAGGNGDIDLKWGENFETVWENFETLSSALGVSDPSPLLKSRLEAIEAPARSPRILYLDRSGATAGPNTFVDAVIKAAGGTNIIQNPGWQSPDIETLIRLQPDIILNSFMDSDYAGVTDRALRHKALADKIQSVPRITVPSQYWTCAGPGLIEAAEHLNQALAEL